MASLYMTTAPPAILREIADPSLAADRFDPVFTTSETARLRLKITLSVLNMWQRRDLGRHLRPDAGRSTHRALRSIRTEVFSGRAAISSTLAWMRPSGTFPGQ